MNLYLQVCNTPVEKEDEKYWGEWGGGNVEQTVMNTFTDFARLTNCNVTVVFAR